MSNPGLRKSVISSELAWHEQEAHRRIPLDIFLYAPPAFDAIVRSGFAFLQLRPGEWVLDLGCGEGKETLRLAQQGLSVVSVDLSFQQLCRARQQVCDSAPQARVGFVQANAEELPFASGSFKTLYGKAILHHLDLDLTGQEVQRVLRPGGHAALAEPMAHHPLFWLARRLSTQLRTKDEHPLTFKQMRHFGACFGQSEIEAFFLLTPLSYGYRLLPGGEPLFRWLHAFLQQVDQRIFTIFSWLRELAGYGLVKVKK